MAHLRTGEEIAICPLLQPIRTIKERSGFQHLQLKGADSLIVQLEIGTPLSHLQNLSLVFNMC